MQFFKTAVSFVFLLSILLGMSSCEETPYDPKEFLPAAKGNLGEITVVIDKNYWQGPVMTELQDVFQQEVISLPQPEPLMEMNIIAPAGFSKGTNQHHSVLIIDIDNSAANSKAYLSEQKIDRWAIGQIVYTLRAPTQDDAVKVLQEHKAELLNAYLGHTKAMINANFVKTKSTAINEELAITMGINMNVPGTFTVSANHNDFIWMQQHRQKYTEGQDHEIQLGILVYTYPYTDSLAFTQEKILAKRDSMTKKYIPGFIENSYMKTERSYGLESSQKEIDGKYFFETRGVWKMHNAIMGGPFVSLTVYDAKKERIVTLDGYVYAPHFRKMEYIREIEAILYSYSFTE